MPELSQDKIFKYLTAVLGLLVVVLLVREIFFSSTELTIPEITFPITEVNVRTEVFDEFNVGDLIPFQTLAMPEIVGRDKPFEPYSIEEYNAALEALSLPLVATSSPSEGVITYENREYGFTMTYSSDWNVYTDIPIGDRFLKGDLDFDRSVSGEINDNDCFFDFIHIPNIDKLTPDDYFKELIAGPGENIRLGNNDFKKHIIQTDENDEGEQEIVGLRYSTINTKREEKELLSFLITKTSENTECASEVLRILGTLEMY